MLQVGIGREVITPSRGIPLCGYFNPRPNTGILDDLFVRTVIFKQNNVVSGLVVFDLCFLGTDTIEKIKAGIKAAGMNFGGNLIFSATHTHSGPYPDFLFGVKPDPKYMELVKDKAVSSVKQAYANLSQAELMTGSVKNNPLAFNRRYWMKNGKVLTNPGKLNPDIVKPEGPVDTEISVLAVKQDGRISAIIANIVNHTDTIGSDFVSADWPGRMERAIQNAIGYDVPVLTLIGCSGNINHIDVSNGDEYYSYAETCRVGTTYAGIIGGILKKLKKLPVARIAVSSTKLDIPYRTISDVEVKNAKATLARIGNTASNENLTSEGIATGDGPVAKFFAEQLVEYKKVCSGKSRRFTLLSIKFDDALAFISIPGEAFTEIGLEIKKRSHFKKTLPISLAMGECGYISMPECFSRGGYEILPVAGGGPREDTAKRIIAACIELLNKVIAKVP